MIDQVFFWNKTKKISFLLIIIEYEVLETNMAKGQNTKNCSHDITLHYSKHLPQQGVIKPPPLNHGRSGVVVAEYPNIAFFPNFSRD
jgi:hypothetical protein